jgi:hypothetical protein
MDDALPIEVALADPDLAADVTSHVESRLGWQVVRPGPHLRVRLRLADDPPGPSDPSDAPTAVVRRAADVDLVRAALAAGAVDVLRWPDDAGRLPHLVPPSTAARPAGTVLGVAGSASGVGTTTVALALGALHAWAGRRTVVLTDRAGRRMAGDPDAGVAGIRGLRVVDDLLHVGPDDAEVLVADRGVGRRATVLVARPDAGLVGALADPVWGSAAVVTVGEGGLRPGELARLVGGRAHVHLDWSFRVARAALCGRVPIGLPGRHLAALGPIARAGGDVPRGRAA